MDIISDFVKILVLKRYSKQTINSYKSHLHLTQSFFQNKPFKEITDKERLWIRNGWVLEYEFVS